MLSGVTGGFADLVLPGDRSGRAWVRVVAEDGSGADESDGPVFIRPGQVRAGVARVLAPVGGARFKAGEQAEIYWVSPPNSVGVDLKVWDGVSWQPLANSLADRGHYMWLVPALSTDVARIQLTFRDLSGAQLGNPVVSAAFSIKQSSDLEPGNGSCAGVLDGAGNLSLPVIQFGNSPMMANLTYQGLDNGQMIYAVTGPPQWITEQWIHDPSVYKCQPATLSEEFVLTVPLLKAGGNSFHALLRPRYVNGALSFVVSEYGGIK